jgi:hypothetical protein
MNIQNYKHQKKKNKKIMYVLEVFILIATKFNLV